MNRPASEAFNVQEVSETYIPNALDTYNPVHEFTTPEPVFNNRVPMTIRPEWRPFKISSSAEGYNDLYDRHNDTFKEPKNSDNEYNDSEYSNGDRFEGYEDQTSDYEQDYNDNYNIYYRDEQEFEHYKTVNESLGKNDKKRQYF